MPIYATAEALHFWKPGHARSLAASRFVTLTEPDKDSDWRKTSCSAIKKGATIQHKISAYFKFITELSRNGASLVFGKLEARMIIDAGNGVLENGGISLDRTSGVPFIPGSAVKGCARRYAIWKLGETVNLEDKAHLLAEICFTFGYADQEWDVAPSGESHRPTSEFWLAMHPLSEPGKQHDEARNSNWEEVANKAALIIMEKLGRTPKSGIPILKQLPNLAGSVCFLPSYPSKDQGIDIDVLTPHHKEYYDDSNSKATATDDENPIPIFFPTVPKGVSFTFIISPNRNQITNISFAENCLCESIQLFGIGGKTSAGYGWFSIDVEAQINFKNLTTTERLSSKYKDFFNWSEDQKEEAILELSDLRSDCVIWEQISPSEFTPISEYARNLEIELL